MSNNIEAAEEKTIKQHITSIKSDIDFLAKKYAKHYPDQKGIIDAIAKNAKTEADKLLNDPEIAQYGQYLPIFLTAINFLRSSNEINEEALGSAIEKLHGIIQKIEE